MKEFVGICKNCGKELFCMDGFFNGVHTEEQTLKCFECAEKEEEK